MSTITCLLFPIDDTDVGKLSIWRIKNINLDVKWLSDFIDQVSESCESDNDEEEIDEDDECEKEGDSDEELHYIRAHKNDEDEDWDKMANESCSTSVEDKANDFYEELEGTIIDNAEFAIEDSQPVSEDNNGMFRAYFSLAPGDLDDLMKGEGEAIDSDFRITMIVSDLSYKIEFIDGNDSIFYSIESQSPDVVLKKVDQVLGSNNIDYQETLLLKGEYSITLDGKKKTFDIDLKIEK